MKLVVIDLLALASAAARPTCSAVAHCGIQEIMEGSPLRHGTPIWENPRTWLSYNEAGKPASAARKGAKAADLILIGTETSHPIISMLVYPDMDYRQWYHMPYQFELDPFVPYHREGMRLFMANWPLGGISEKEALELTPLEMKWSITAYETSAFIANKAKHTIKSFYSI